MCSYPLTCPESNSQQKRKAQNRAAQRAFRERKEQHLKELETKIDDLQKSSDSANQENGLLRAQIDRMQVELREYRTRISWLTHGNGASAMSAIPGSYSKGSGVNNNDFLFDFPKFGDLPGAHIFGNSQSKKNPNASAKDTSQIPGVLSREALSSQSASRQSASKNGSMHSHSTSSPASHATRNSSSDGKAGNRNDAAAPARANGKPLTNDSSNSDSPSSSSDSHQSQLLSSNDTSPESSPNFFPGKQKTGHENCGHIDGEKSFCDQLGLACGSINNPIPAVRHNSASASNTPNQANPAGNEDPDFGLDLLSQQNGGQFDPVLFGDWREPQDAILSQDFGSYFNDAFPLPELGSPSHNFADLPSQPTPAPKKDAAPGGNNKLDEEVVPGEDKSQMLTCTKIWYVWRLILAQRILTYPGIDSSLWTNSAMAKLMSTISAPSCAPKRAAPRAALSSIRTMSTISCATSSLGGIRMPFDWNAYLISW